MNLLPHRMPTISHQQTITIFQRLRVASAALLLVGLPAAVQAEDYQYTIASGAVTIDSYIGSGGDVVIPGTIEDLPVTAIGDSAFQNRLTLTGVTIPDSVTSIGNHAFDSSSLTGVTIPANVASLGEEAFGRCRSLTSITVDAANANYSSMDGVLFNKAKTTLIQYPAGQTGSYTIPTSVTDIASYAFATCTSLTDVTLPNNVTNIGNHAFYFCSGLTYAALGSGVTSIGNEAFLACSSLASITVPNSVTSIGDSAFYGCDVLTSVSLGSGVATIGDSAFQGCPLLVEITVDALNVAYSSVGGVLYHLSGATRTLIQCPAAKTGSYTIPNGVTHIGNAAFYNCGNLTGVTIPNGVTSIGDEAFRYCDNLTSITIPNGVTTIGNGAFAECTGLTSVTIPNGVTRIGPGTFFFCYNLTGVTIPASVTTIDSSAFTYCSGLTSATFHGNAPAIDSSVFNGAASGFTIYYCNDKTGFTAPPWLNYPAVNMGDSALVVWLYSKGVPYNADLQADANNDGVNLLMAYALNLDPNLNLCGSMPRPVLAANQLSLTYYAASGGVSYTVEASADLKSWSATGVTLSGLDANNMRTATVARPGPNRYMRLVVAY